MNAQSLRRENPVISPIHITGRHMLLVATLVVVTFSMLLCLCILFAYNAPFVFMMHLFAFMSSLPATFASALTFAITGGTAIILWAVLFLCTQQERVTQHNKNTPLVPSYFPASTTPRFSPAPVAPVVPMQQRTQDLFFSQPLTSPISTPAHKNQTAWEANFTREIEAKQNVIRLRQRSRELRLQTHGSITSNEDHTYQMKRTGTRNFYKKAPQGYSLHQQQSAEQSAPFNEIYWWSTLPDAQELSLKSTEGITKITNKMLRQHTT